MVFRMSRLPMVVEYGTEELISSSVLSDSRSGSGPRVRASPPLGRHCASSVPGFLYAGPSGVGRERLAVPLLALRKSGPRVGIEVQTSRMQPSLRVMICRKALASGGKPGVSIWYVRNSARAGAGTAAYGTHLSAE